MLDEENDAVIGTASAGDADDRDPSLDASDFLCECCREKEISTQVTEREFVQGKSLAAADAKSNKNKSKKRRKKKKKQAAAGQAAPEERKDDKPEAEDKTDEEEKKASKKKKRKKRKKKGPQPEVAAADEPTLSTAALTCDSMEPAADDLKDACIESLDGSLTPSEEESMEPERLLPRPAQSQVWCATETESRGWRL